MLSSSETDGSSRRSSGTFRAASHPSSVMRQHTTTTSTNGFGVVRSPQRVAVPKPVNTKSTKFESGCFDMAAVLVPSSANGNVWGVDSNASKQTKKPNNAQSNTPTAGSSTTSKEQTKEKQQQIPPETKLAAPLTNPKTEGGREAASARGGSAKSPWADAERGETQQQQPQSDPEYEAHFPSVGQAPPAGHSDSRVRPLDGSPPRNHHHHGKASVASHSDVMSVSPVSDPDGLEEHDVGATGADDDRGAGDGNASSSGSSASHEVRPLVVVQQTVFQTPCPDDAQDEAEKERRRKALALEQQQLILQRVQQARKTQNPSGGESRKKSVEPPKVQQKPRSQPKPARSPAADTAKATTCTHTPKPVRGPRTKGRLFKRMEDGTVVEDKSQPRHAGGAQPPPPSNKKKPQHHKRPRGSRPRRQQVAAHP